MLQCCCPESSRKRESCVNTNAMSGRIHVIMYNRNPTRERYGFDRIAFRSASIPGDCDFSNLSLAAHAYLKALGFLVQSVRTHCRCNVSA